MLNGVINVYKEKGFTSHDVVAKLRGILKQKKIGHTGTLDPDATGVLPVCLGNATKLCDMLTDGNKEYVTTFQLGFSTDTQDIGGTVCERREVSVSEDEVREVILSFIGEYEQLPPMYSALKVNGKKLYELAREGIEIERKKRRVEILSLDIMDICLPFVTMRVGCSKGTYIRTLCHDIGLKLGCLATMTELKRTMAAGFLVQDAHTLSEIQEYVQNGGILKLLTATEDMLDFTDVHVAEPYEKLVWNGNMLYANQIMERIRLLDEEKVKVYAKDKFCGVYVFDEKTHTLRPFKMFLE